MRDDAESVAAAVSATAEGVAVRVKVVPGASRSRVAGVLGDRLKVQVAAPAEGGKANAALAVVVAAALGVAEREVTIEAGHTQPRKTLAVRGVTLCNAVARLRAAL
mgnify:CR=1 FL=1